MPTLIQRLPAPAPGNRSPLVGLFLWQLDDQSRRLTEDTRGATADELAWRPTPGTNTIGMLLAHIALVEVGWVSRGVLGKGWSVPEALPLDWPEGGIPLREHATPPAVLAGKELPWFDDLLARARKHTRAAVAALSDDDLDRRFRVTAAWEPDAEFEATVGWVLYHILEHEAGHYGQINLLRHQYRVQTRAGGRT
jgi:uncharacterized damage-inducible protein DinB